MFYCKRDNIYDNENQLYSQSQLNVFWRALSIELAINFWAADFT